MTWAVVFSRKAREQLIALDEYIAAAASPEIADRYIRAITDYCLSLETFPERGLRRGDIRPGVRITNYRKRTVVAFAIDPDAESVTILGIFHGGQDYEASLSEQGN